MPTPKQPLFVPLGNSIRTDVDPKLLPLGSTLELQNVRVQRTGEVVSRPGGVALPGTNNTPMSLATHKGALVALSACPDVNDEAINILTAPDGLHSFITNASVLTAAQGQTSASLLKVAADAIQPDVAIGSNGGGTYYAVAYANTAGTTIHLDIFDIETGHRAKAFSTTPASPLAAYHVVVCNGFAVLAYETTAVPSPIVFVAINLLTLASTTTTVAGVAAGGPVESGRFDLMVKDSTTVSCAFVDNTVTFVTCIDFVPSTSTTTAWKPLTAAAGNITTPSVLTWSLDLGASGKQALATVNAAGLTVNWAFPTSGATRQATNTYVLDAGLPTAASMTMFTTTSAATGEFTVLYTIAASPTTNNRTVASGRYGGVITATFSTFRSMSLQSKAFTIGGLFYALFGFRSTTQGTRYLMQVPSFASQWPRNTTAIVTVNQGVETLFDSGASLSGVAVTSSTARTIAVGYLLRADLGTALTGYNPQAAAVQLVTLTFLQPPNLTLGIPREYADSLFVPGAQPMQFDGVSYWETGFPYFPEQPTLTVGTGGANVYVYKLVYSDVDAQGRLWRSADSIPKTSGGSAALGGGNNITVVCPTLRIGGRSTSVTIEIYRTVAGDSVTFQKIGTVANDVTVDSVNFVDAITDAVQATGEFLYTNGGVLANDTTPGMLGYAANQGRILGISLDDRQTIWPSDVPAFNNGPRFSQDTVFDVRDQHGDMTAIAALDDKWIVFKADSVYAISGSGPDEFGRGGFNVQLVANGLGTTNPQSVLETKDGVIFRSTSTRAGFFMIDRGLSIQYIGAGVQKYNSLTITGAILIPQRSLAEFYSSTGTVLVYDLTNQTWSIDTGKNANAAVAWNGSAVYAVPSSTLVIEDSSGAVWQDTGTDYIEHVESPWLQLSALRTFERFFRIQGVGETVGNHTLTIDLYKDFEASPFATKTLAVTAVGLPRWDWELRYSTKLEALKVALTMSTGPGGATGKARVSGVTLIIGSKGTLRPFPAANRAT